MDNAFSDAFLPCVCLTHSIMFLHAWVFEYILFEWNRSQPQLNWWSDSNDLFPSSILRQCIVFLQMLSWQINVNPLAKKQGTSQQVLQFVHHMLQGVSYNFKADFKAEKWRAPVWGPVCLQDFAIFVTGFLMNGSTVSATRNSSRSQIFLCHTLHNIILEIERYNFKSTFRCTFHNQDYQSRKTRTKNTQRNHNLRL